MGKFTVYGDACGELLRAQAGALARTDDERALRIATLVHMNMGKGADQRRAVALIKAVASDGLEAAALICTVQKKAAPEIADAPSRVPLGQEIAVIKARGSKAARR